MTTQPITDRPPTERDADAWGEVLWDTATGWAVVHWTVAAKDRLPWLHTPSWVDKPDWLGQAMRGITVIRDFLRLTEPRESWAQAVGTQLDRIEDAVQELAK